MRSLREGLIRICQKKCCVFRLLERKRQLEEKLQRQQEREEMQNQVREKNYIFKGPLTQSLTNEILCFFIAGFPMDAGMGRQWRRLGRQCR